MAALEPESIARWCNGSTSAFGAESPGSNPGRAAILGKFAGYYIS